MYPDGIPVTQRFHAKGPLYCSSTYGASKENEMRRRPLHSMDYEDKVKLVYFPINDMLADRFTKALPSAKGKHFATALGLLFAADPKINRQVA
jgi:hypothetical protein